MPKQLCSYKLSQETVDKIIACNGNLTMNSIANVLNLHLVTIYAVLRKNKIKPVRNNYHRLKKNAH